MIGLDDACYVVDVDYSTNDDLKEGNVAIGTNRVVVLAPDAVTAQLVACEMGFVPSHADS